MLRIFLCFIALFSSVLEGADPKICLAITIRNDDAYIWRCLHSVEAIIDCVCVCNIDSVGNFTLAALDEFITDKKLPTKIFEHHWENEGYNQTLLVKKAQEAIRDFGFPLEETYILLLDSNQTVEIGSDFKKLDLQADSHSLFEKLCSPLFCQYSPNLFRASLSWECKGPLYEIWNRHNSQERISSLKVTTEEPYLKYRELKLENDLKILSDLTKTEPENPYYLFYLAQTNRALNRYKEAISFYKKYLTTDENREKLWFSRFMLGECYQELGLWEKALNAYLDAYQFNPNRTEPIWKIASYYRTQGKNDLAYLFAKHGSRIPFSTEEHSLFPFEPIKDYCFDEELSISSYYTRFKSEGLFAIDSIMLNKKAPSHLKTNTLRNLLFYVEKLPNATFLPIDIELPYIVEDLPDRYNPMNPSILKTPTGYKVICRTVNYTQEGAKSFHTVDYDGIFRTRNFLLTYNPDFKLLSQKEIIENLPRDRIRTFSLEGLDDCRIFQQNGTSWFTCTTGDTNPCGNFQISLCKLEDDTLYEDIYVEKLTPLQGPDPYRCEKNWLPFVFQDQLRLIYSYSPFTLYQPDPETGECKTVLSYESEYDFSSFRGSAGPIPFDDGYLMLVHEVTLFQNQSRCYLHRFLYLNKQFIVEKLSLPFIFKHQGVEYCCGMTTNHAESELILSIGIEDREAELCFVDLPTIRSLLRSL